MVKCGVGEKELRCLSCNLWSQKYNIKLKIVVSAPTVFPDYYNKLMIININSLINQSITIKLTSFIAMSQEYHDYVIKIY